jgi:hypothetical protein
MPFSIPPSPLRPDHLLGRLFIALSLLTVPVQAEALNTRELEGYASQLEQLRKAVISQRSKENGVALRSFTKHAASPVASNAFYLECLKKLRFTDEGKRAEAWRTYRENNDTLLNSAYHRQAKQMELQYLILTIQAAQEVDRRNFMPKIINFVENLLAMDGRAYEHMDNAESSVFTEAYDIQNSIDPGDWQMDPTNVEGIYDSAILPHMRNHRDPRLVTAWLKKIEHMTAYAEKVKQGEAATQREVDRDERRGGRSGGGRFGGRSNPETSAEARAEVDRYEEFMTETLPETRWEMCEDLVEHGFRDEAIPQMFSVIRAHADFRDVPTWLTSLDAVIQSALKGEPAEPSTSAN